MFVLFAPQFELTERKKARSEYEKMLFRQEMEAEELRISSESALKELQQLQVSCAFRCLTTDSVESSKMLRVTWRRSGISSRAPCDWFKNFAPLF